MKKKKIYLSGAMTGLSFDDQMKWRKQIQDAIKYEYDLNPEFFNPVEYYNFEEKNYKSEREVMEFDLYNLRNSDLVIVNFNNEKSIGTAMELVIAKEMNKPVIAFGIEDKEIHPWLLECCTRVCDSMREAVNYTVEFYLR